VPNLKQGGKVKNMAIEKVFLIAIEYYNCDIQIIDDIILIAPFDGSFRATCFPFGQYLG
jgi:hypothetical protein